MSTITSVNLRQPTGFGLFIGAFTVLAYGLACVKAEVSPYKGAVELILLGLLVSMPGILESVLTGMVMNSCFAFLMLIFPIIIPFVLIYKIFSIVARLANSILLLLVGILLYGTLYCVPGLMSSGPLDSLSAQHPSLASSVVFVTGGALMATVGWIAWRCGYSARCIALCTLGFPAFLVLLLVSLDDLAAGDLGNHSHHS
ncbi:MAG TPA: hypothetical protein VJU82_07945 [Acidobacteriaceae bacterium]|nr:hypothetical protein [Acidobacteriaceae bacterium]